MLEDKLMPWRIAQKRRRIVQLLTIPLVWFGDYMRNIEGDKTYLFGGITEAKVAQGFGKGAKDAAGTATHIEETLK